jgi:hypothetical protein
VVQVENKELLYGTGTGHFAGFFSTSLDFACGLMEGV